MPNPFINQAAPTEKRKPLASFVSSLELRETLYMCVYIYTHRVVVFYVLWGSMPIKTLPRIFQALGQQVSAAL